MSSSPSNKHFPKVGQYSEASPKTIWKHERVLFNQEERISIPFFFEPSYDFILDPKYLDINENLIYNIDNYEDFLTNSLKKFVEYDRPA